MKTLTDTELYDEPFAEVLNTYGGRPFYRIGNNLFFDGERVHSDFPSLMSVPWSLHTSIRFNLPEYQSEHADTPKRLLLERLFNKLNKRIQLRYKNIKSGNDTARYIYSNEFGASDDEVHLHLLTHLHQEVRDLVKDEVLDFFKGLNGRLPSGVESIHTTDVYDTAGIVSYICKVERDSVGRDRLDKKLRFSKGFQKIIKRKFYKPNEMPDPFRILVEPV
jgi:hypothetical protein